MYDVILYNDGIWEYADSPDFEEKIGYERINWI